MKFDFHSIDKYIKDHQWDRALVNFIYQKGNDVVHIGTGFLYTDNRLKKTFVLTAKHVIDNCNLYKEGVFVAIKINKDGMFINVDMVNNDFLHFYNIDDLDCAFSELNVNRFLSMTHELEPAKKPRLLPFNSRELDDKPSFINNIRLVFGCTAVENKFKTFIREYSFNWRTIFTRYINRNSLPKIPTNLKEFDILEFDAKKMCTLKEGIDLKEHFVDGNYPVLKGMSGCPCLDLKLINKNENEDLFIFDNVCGMLVEQINKPPFNGKVLLITPISAIMYKIHKFYK